MSNSCFRTCTVVILYCAVLFAQVSLTVSVRDSQSKNIRSETIRSVNLLYRTHPNLRNAVLTDNMRSLLISLKRRKRILHHGKSNKIWRTTRTKSTAEYKTTRKPPLVNIDDIESPISSSGNSVQNSECNPPQNISENNEVVENIKEVIHNLQRYQEYEEQKHQCRLLQFGGDTIAVDYYNKPRSLVRRAAALESKRPISKRSYNWLKRSAIGKREAEEPSAPTEMPIVITEIIEVGKKANEYTLLRRQANDEMNTTCVVLTEGVSQAVDANATVGANGGGNTSTTVTTSPVGEPGANTPSMDAGAAVSNKVTPPVLQLNGDLDGGKVVNTQPTFAAMLTTPGALMAAAPLPPQVIATTIDPGKFYQTLDEILEDVESLADQKQTANEDFPCHVNGSWISEAGGVRLEISIKNDSLLDVVRSEPVGKTKINQQGFLSNNSWTLSGSIPLGKKSMVILNAVNDNENQIATFIGECKVCHHTETMAGHWLHVKSARDCNDQKDSFKILSDLWRRETLHGLKKQRFKALSTSTTAANATKLKGNILTTCIPVASPTSNGH